MRKKIWAVSEGIAVLMNKMWLIAAGVAAVGLIAITALVSTAMAHNRAQQPSSTNSTSGNNIIVPAQSEATPTPEPTQAPAEEASPIFPATAESGSNDVRAAEVAPTEAPTQATTATPTVKAYGSDSRWGGCEKDSSSIHHHMQDQSSFVRNHR